MEFKRIAIYPIGLLVALGVCAVLLFLTGINPLSAYSAIFRGSFGSAHGISETFVKTIPLLLTTLAFSLPYWAGFWNIGGEGQLFIGALAAVLLALSLGSLPGPISIPLIFFVSFLAGMAWIVLPLVLKTKLGVNEIFLTVALNFIAILLISYLCVGPIREPGHPNPQTATIPLSTWLPRLMPPLRLHMGVFLPLLAAFLIYTLLFKTSLGYKIRVVGLSPRTARYSGIKISRIVIIATLLGGGLAGLAGAGEVLGVHHFLTARFPVGLGYTGILVAVLGKFNPIWEIPASIFFAALLVGGETMQRIVGVPFGMIYILIALITFIILAIEKAMERRK